MEKPYRQDTTKGFKLFIKELQLKVDEMKDEN